MGCSWSFHNLERFGWKAAGRVIDAMFEDETPVAWTVAQPDAAVVAADGTEIGRTEKILGDEEEDIFHGIAMRRADDGETVEVPAARVTKFTGQHVVTDLSPDEAGALRLYEER
jgi:hypothetical protein